MLKGIDNRLNADVLYVLRSMGHGDALVIADTNFPRTRSRGRRSTATFCGWRT
jgi:L-fucose mutarotase/ribose pyranase (RbsD/FucU family)